MDIIADVPASIQCFLLHTLKRRCKPAAIIPDIFDLQHYIFLLMMLKPRRLFCPAVRPACCPHCGRRNPWGHGGYWRKSDRENVAGHTLNPVYIQRYYCPRCRRTCSVLPECIPPRRWYLWQVQQAGLSLWLAGQSLNAIARQLNPSRDTFHRWIGGFQEQFSIQRDALVTYIQALFSMTEFEPFWQMCFKTTSLAKAMRICHTVGVYVP